tara:strand:- start:21198 stop:25067 length:3870 start_codon:yes stop_codon:yes gene_type:complete
MASEYRQLGTARFQPQQQIGGWNYQATRDLGSEQLLKGFANLSQSLTQAGQQYGQEEIKKAVAEGEAWRKQSQKTFRDAVAAGEIHPSQNPHFAIGAMAADGEMNARAMTSQWLSEWQQETANPDSEAARTQGGFEAFMQDRLTTYAEENPFVSQYQSNAFYDIAHRTITGNSVKQNEDALARDLAHTSRRHTDSLLSIEFSADAPDESQAELQTAYDKLYESGALTPEFKAMFLERVYLTALSPDLDVHPKEYVERYRGLMQNGASLGETEAGLQASAKYRAALDVVSNKWEGKRTAEIERSHARGLVTHEDFEPISKTQMGQLEQVILVGGDVEAKIAEIVESHQIAGAAVLARYGKDSKEWFEYKDNMEALELKIITTRQDTEVVGAVLGSFDSLSSKTDYEALGDEVGNTERNNYLWDKHRNDPQALAQILQHSKFPPLERHFLDHGDMVRDGYQKKTWVPSDVPASLVENFKLYAQLRSHAATQGNLFHNKDNLVSQVYEAAWMELGTDHDETSYAVALATALGGDAIRLPSTGSASSGSAQLTNADEKALANTVPGWFNLPQSAKSHIIDKVRELAPKMPVVSKEQFAAAVKELEDADFFKNYTDHYSFSEFPAGVLPVDEGKQEQFLGDWMRGSFASAANEKYIQNIGAQLYSPEAKESLREAMGLPFGTLITDSMMDRHFAWKVLGGHGTVPSDMKDAAFGRVTDGLKKGPAGQIFRMLGTSNWFLEGIGMDFAEWQDIIRLEDEEQSLAWVAQNRDRFTDGLAGFFLGDEPISLEGIMHRAPAEALTYLREQEWYQGSESAAHLSGWLDPDNIYIQYTPDGGAMVYTRDDEDSPFERYMPHGSAGAISGFLTPDMISTEVDRFLQHDRETGGMRLMGRPISDERVREMKHGVSSSAEEADKGFNLLWQAFGKATGLEVGPANPMQKIESIQNWATMIPLRTHNVVYDAIVPEDSRERTSYYHLRETVSGVDPSTTMAGRADTIPPLSEAHAREKLFSEEVADAGGEKLPPSKEVWKADTPSEKSDFPLFTYASTTDQKFKFDDGITRPFLDHVIEMRKKYHIPSVGEMNRFMRNNVERNIREKGGNLVMVTHKSGFQSLEVQQVKTQSEVAQVLYGWTAEEFAAWEKAGNIVRGSWEEQIGGGPYEQMGVFTSNEIAAHERIRKPKKLSVREQMKIRDELREVAVDPGIIERGADFYRTEAGVVTGLDDRLHLMDEGEVLPEQEPPTDAELLRPRTPEHSDADHALRRRRSGAEVAAEEVEAEIEDREKRIAEEEKAKKK